LAHIIAKYTKEISDITYPLAYASDSDCYASVRFSVYLIVWLFPAYHNRLIP